MLRRKVLSGILSGFAPLREFETASKPAMHDATKPDHIKQLTTRIARLGAQSRRARVMLALGSVGGYALLFFALHPVMGGAAAALVILPVAAIGWLWGMWAGLLAGLLSIMLNTLLLNLAGEAGWDVVFRTGGGPGFVTLALIGAAVGRLRDLSDRVKLQLAERERAEEALRDTTAALNSTLNLEEVLDRILANVGRVVPHDAASVMLIEASVSYLVRRVGYMDPVAGSGVRSLRFRVADVPTLREMSESGQPLVIPDTRTYTGWVDRPETHWIRSYVGAPIRMKGQTIGFLNLNSAAPGFFTATHAERLLVFADHTAIAIDNARLYGAERRRVETLAALHEAGLALNTQLDLPVLLQTIVERAARLLGSPMGELYLLLPDEQTLELKAGYNLPGELTGLRLRLGQGFSGRIAQTGEPLIVGNYNTWPGRLTAFDHIPFGSVVGAPIKWQERVTGVILVDDFQPERFEPADVQSLSFFANQAAIAIENAQLYDAIRRHAGELEQRVIERTAELDRERQRLATILDATGEGIALIDRNHVIVYVNAAMEQLTGYTLAEVLNHTIDLWSHEHTPPAVNEALERCFERGEPWRGEVISGRKDGTHYDAALTIIPLRGADGAIVGYVVSQRDITHLKELERLRNQFVSRIGHELRTPLSNIRLYVELLERGKPEKRAEYMKTLWRETARLQKLIEGFLEISQLDAGMLPVNPVPTDLNQLLGRVIGEHSALAAERGLTLTLHPDPGLPRVLADPELVDQVIANLLENALRYTPRGGRIAVRTALRRREEREWVTLAVQDTGPGISPEEIPRLFGRFYRGEAARDFSTPGAGLGLAISKAIVDRLEGRITVDGGVEGEPPQRQGATFVVWLRPAMG